MSKAPEHMSQHELESYLWGAAKLLRGLIDAGDYKQYVFPLLFFKRLSDVWDEEHQAALDETGDKTYARATADDRFAIPDGAHWSDVRGASRFRAKFERDGSVPHHVIRLPQHGFHGRHPGVPPQLPFVPFVVSIDLVFSIGHEHHSHNGLHELRSLRLQPAAYRESPEFHDL